MRFGELLRGDSRYAADQCVVGFLSAEYLADQLFGRLQIVLREECLTLELRVGYLSALAVEGRYAVCDRVGAHGHYRRTDLNDVSESYHSRTVQLFQLLRHQHPALCILYGLLCRHSPQEVRDLSQLSAYSGGARFFQFLNQVSALHFSSTILVIVSFMI